MSTGAAAPQGNQLREPAPAPATDYVLTLDCAESPGIVHAVADFLLDHGCFILDIKQFGDPVEQHFFMRVHFSTTGSGSDANSGTGSGSVAAAGAEAAAGADELRRSFVPVAAHWNMKWRLEPRGRKQRILVMVSKYGHCLNDLLFRTRNGELPVEIVAVVSNHPDHRDLVAWHGIPFHHIPVNRETKEEAESELLHLVDRYDVELVVLARYMQVLSDNLTRRLAGRAINIHHSFLPSFKGARPYHQAYERGVKTVGATAHYVNSELDEGPIIAQQVIEVDHTYSPADLVAVGRDAECKALSNAVRWHSEGRIILSGNRTVILR